jgi:ankyrin repeat protein
MFSAKDRYGWTAWHVASKKGQIEVLDKLSEWSKEVLTQDEFWDMLLLAED